MSEWQPIETAPKDWTVIDLWCRGGSRAGRQTDMWWVKGLGWRGAIRNAYREDVAKGATHWMPLPAAPEEEPR